MMEKFRGYIFTDLVLIAVLTVISAVVFRAFMPDMYPRLLWLIPVYFVFQIGVMLAVFRMTEKAGKSINTFIMVYRPVRSLLLILLLVIYLICVRETIIQFTAVLVVFYFVLLIYETLFFSKLVKQELK